MVHPVNGILFSIEKNEILIYTTIWTNLENTISLSEINQTQKDKYCMILLTRGIVPTQ